MVMSMMMMTLMLLMILSPALLEIVLEAAINIVILTLEVVASFVFMVTYLLMVAVAFSIASLVFFAICLRFGDDGESLDESDSNRFWVWTRWG